MHPPLNQYLDRYAEPESRSISVPSHDCVVVIPSLGEDTTPVTQSLFSSAARQGKTCLVILIVNNRADHPGDWIRINRQYITAFVEIAHTLSKSPGIYFKDSVLLIDRSNPPDELPSRQGVGLARKIGCDIALRLIAGGAIRERWIRTTDADCLVPEDYFADLEPDMATWLYPFEHVLDWDKQYEANALAHYDYFLRYYAGGLRSAGSPYAFLTLGSTLAIHADAYATVRGFPKTVAAEDFYCLNKLAKVGSIKTLERLPIRIRQRISSRVPFGTGVSTLKSSIDFSKGTPFRIYHPDSFSLLRIFLEECRVFSEHHDVRRARCAQPTISRAVLERLGTFEAMKVALRTRKTPHQIHRHLMDWFDAFRTLKFIHGLRDNGLGTVECRLQVLRQALFT